MKLALPILLIILLVGCLSTTPVQEEKSPDSSMGTTGWTVDLGLVIQETPYLVPGQFTRLVFALRNDGNLEAKGVEISLDSNIKEIVWKGKREFYLGNIKPGEQSKTVFTQFSSPPANKKVPIDIKIRQQVHPDSNMTLPIKTKTKRKLRNQVEVK